MRVFYVASLLLLVQCSFAQSQLPTDINGVALADSLQWDAYNKCDLTRMKSYFTNDVEFYHDKGGVTYGVEALIQSFEKGPCSNRDSFSLRRAVAPNTFKIYPLNKDGKLYGAVLTGEHIFYWTEKNKKERASGQAKFANLWIIEDGYWKMKRVFSYDHQAAPAVNETTTNEIPTAKRTTTAVPNATLKEYAGRYQNRKSEYLIVQSAKGYLIISSGNESFFAYPSSSTLFFVKDRDLTFQFAKKGAGVIDVTVRENGEVTETYSASRR